MQEQNQHITIAGSANAGVSMSLPWRHLSVDDYVESTKKKLETLPEAFKHLRIGNFFLQGDASSLTESHIVDLLFHGNKHACLDSLSLGGITVEGDSLQALATLLGSDINSHRTWKQVALDACQGRAVRGIAMASNLHVVTLSITDCHLNSSDFESLGSMLASTTTKIQNLNLFNEIFGDQGTELFARGFGRNTSLENLRMGHCHFSDSAIGFISEGLRVNTALLNLHLPGCEMEDPALANLLSGLDNHATLQGLNIYRNHGSHATSQVIANLSLPQLRTLEISSQQFERVGKLHISGIVESIISFPHLSLLNLAFNKLNDHDATTIANYVFDHPTVRELDLRANKIKDAGMCIIANKIPETTLKRLSLLGNPFGLEGSKALVLAVQHADLEVLSLDYNCPLHREIQYHIWLNQAGNRLLKHNDVPLCLWPTILSRAAKISFKSRGGITCADIQYHMLKSFPALYHVAADAS